MYCREGSKTIMTRQLATTVALAATLFSAGAYSPSQLSMVRNSCSNSDAKIVIPSSSSRRGFISQSVAFALGSATASIAASNLETLDNNISIGGVANAVGPVKIDLVNPTYNAAPCPPSKPIPGEKAMKGMRGLCVTVKAELDENAPKDLDKVGVYGYVNDATTSESVLANNPDSGTDAGQFAIIPKITTTDKNVEFEFIAAVPREKDISVYEDGIGPLEFKSLRIVSFPGGQQYGAINPCEMNEFSDECEAWEEENGPYKKGEFMTKSNPRTKGR
mmetsp:Transcript_12599/g.26575  ORF Transcript_12599/g.26575 Transcript_12599/m.26575 type:complete len:276 (+) Transcript_12599:78-905(+)